MNDSLEFLEGIQNGKITRHETTNSKGCGDIKDDCK